MKEKTGRWYFLRARLDCRKPARAILERCDGQRTFQQIVQELAGAYVEPIPPRFGRMQSLFSNGFGRSGWWISDGHRYRPISAHRRDYSSLSRCTVCIAPILCRWQRLGQNSAAKEWETVFKQAAQLGVLHVHFSGGEPLAREDVVQLVASAHWSGLYTNLITSGIGLSEPRLDALVKAGLDHIQLSFQDSREASANWIAGTRAHALKLQIAPLIRRSGVAFTVNMVIHRQNVDHLEEMIALAESLQPQRLEIAHVQYYGWAAKNVDALLPTRRQVVASLEIVMRPRSDWKARSRSTPSCPTTMHGFQRRAWADGDVIKC